MPLQHSLSTRELAALGSVLSSRAPASSMRYHYRLGGMDLTPYVMEASWGRPDTEAPGREFTGRFGLTLPHSLKKEVLVVDLVVSTTEGDLTFRRYTGDVRVLKARRGRTEISAASGGFWLDKVRFDEDGVSYVDASPSDVMWDVLNRAAENRIYDLRYADIETVDGPKVRREEFLSITKIDKLSRPIAAAVEEGQLFFRDSPYNGPLCHRDRGPAEATQVLFEYVVGVHIDPEGFEPEGMADEYYDVVMYRTTDTGEVEYLIDPILIPGSSAPKGAGYEIAVSDESSAAADDAYELGVRIASRLVDGESEVTFSVNFPHPLLVDGDFISVPEPFIEDNRVGTRYWLGEVQVATERHDLSEELRVTLVNRREETDVVPVVSATARPRVRGS